MMLALASKVTHSDIAAFARDKVNLKRQDVEAHRAQVAGLRNRLEAYIAAHPAFDLVKMLHSGSVAKGTALKTINDMDVAVYVKAGKFPGDEKQLLEWLAARLREAFGELMSADQFVPQTHCVKVQFRGSGLDVDVAPVLYAGAPDDRGYLIMRDTGDRVLTSIPLHLAFTRSRKAAHKTHYRQMVRLVKWWKRVQESQRKDFRFKSFMIELLLAYLFDKGFDGTDYANALFNFFAYIRRTGLKERVIFSDYYSADSIADSTAAIQIYDPVNPQNNVAGQYTEMQRIAIVEAAEDAADAIAYAQRATTKGPLCQCSCRL
jgi:tRNA nucleotidyltransferase (CCA-adding enzyme)